MLRRGNTFGGLSWRARCWPPAVLAAVIVAAAVPRLLRLDVVYVTRDESFSWRIIQYPPRELIRRTARDVHPPLYYLLLQGWSRFAGSGIAALRAMSAAAGVASVVMIYWLVLEACRWGRRQAVGSRTAMHGAALLAAGLLALHGLQIDHARSARMYSLGIFLSLGSSWLLVRALRGGRPAWCWWAACGVVAAMFCYTHNLALFSVAAVGLFVGGLAAREFSRGSRRRARTAACGFAGAGLLALLLYGPWLAVLWQQAATVRQGYWVPAPTAPAVLAGLGVWTTGLAGLTAAESWLAVAALGVLALAVFVWNDRPAYLFSAQAAVPWLLCLTISLLTGTSIFQVRYLAFAHPALIVLVGLAFFHVRRTAPRWMLAWCVAALGVFGCYQRLRDLPRHPPAIVAAMNFVKRHAQTGDVILASSQRTVNRLRYYAHEQGLQDVQVRCVIAPRLPRGHVVHLAALTADDVIDQDRWRTDPPRRLWTVYDRREGETPIPAGRALLVRNRFDDAQGAQYVVALYVDE